MADTTALCHNVSPTLIEAIRVRTILAQCIHLYTRVQCLSRGPRLVSALSVSDEQC